MWASVETGVDLYAFDVAGSYLGRNNVPLVEP
jgi:hypothetical protein